MMAEHNQKEYEFTLTVASIADMTPEMSEALFEAGCDDATVGMRSGVFVASFGREAEAFEDAVFTAMRDIRKAIPGATGFLLDHRDLVSQSDIARRVGKSRQSVSLYVSGKRTPSGKRNLAAFPAAVTDSFEGPLYSWSEVADWLRTHELLSAQAAEEAESRKCVANALEFALGIQRGTPEKAAKMSELVELAGAKA